MVTSRQHPLSALGFASVLVIALMFAIGPRGLAAQQATASPVGTTGMGDCVTALGIGEAGNACIDVVHASPDAPAVDIYLDGSLVLTGLPFGHYTGWLAVPAGKHHVQVTATGTDPSTAVIDANVTLESGAAYQVAATGLLAHIKPEIYQVNLSPLGQDKARIRVIHTSPDAPAVDVAVQGGDVPIKNLAFPKASDALTVPAGTYHLEVRPTGTTNVALDLPGVTLEASTVYDVFAIGQVANGTLEVLVIPSLIVAPAASPAA